VLLKLRYDEPPSHVAFNFDLRFNLRRYTTASRMDSEFLVQLGSGRAWQI
jgi:hypothetical protein